MASEQAKVERREAALARIDDVIADMAEKFGAGEENPLRRAYNHEPDMNHVLLLEEMAGKLEEICAATNQTVDDQGYEVADYIAELLGALEVDNPLEVEEPQDEKETKDKAKANAKAEK